MTLGEILAKAGKTQDQIVQIYHGKDNYCRCGCGGNYFEADRPEDARGFKRAINAMSKPDFKHEPIDFSVLNKGYNFLNITTDDYYPSGYGTCYCLYFEK